QDLHPRQIVNRLLDVGHVLLGGAVHDQVLIEVFLTRFETFEADDVAAYLADRRREFAECARLVVEPDANGDRERCSRRGHESNLVVSLLHPTVAWRFGQAPPSYGKPRSAAVTKARMGHPAASAIAATVPPRSTTASS